MDEMDQIRIFLIIAGLAIFGPTIYFLRRIDRCKGQERAHCLRTYIGLYSLFMLVFGVPFVLLIVFQGLMVGQVVLLALLSAPAYWIVKTPYELSIAEDGTLTLKYIFHQKSVKPGEVRSLKRTAYFVKLSYEPKGAALIPYFHGRHIFLNQLKEANPDLSIGKL